MQADGPPTGPHNIASTTQKRKAKALEPQSSTQLRAGEAGSESVADLDAQELSSRLEDELASELLPVPETAAVPGTQAGAATASRREGRARQLQASVQPRASEAVSGGAGDPDAQELSSRLEEELASELLPEPEPAANGPTVAAASGPPNSPAAAGQASPQQTGERQVVEQALSAPGQPGQLADAAAAPANRSGGPDQPAAAAAGKAAQPAGFASGADAATQAQAGDMPQQPGPADPGQAASQPQSPTSEQAATTGRKRAGRMHSLSFLAASPAAGRAAAAPAAGRAEAAAAGPAADDEEVEDEQLEGEALPVSPKLIICMRGAEATIR